jgi:hypothetical protein
MFWADATDVNAATESPTKNARESLFAYLMTQLHLLRRFHAVQDILFFSAEAMSGSKADIDHAALTYRCLAHGFLSSLSKNEVQRSLNPSSRGNASNSGESPPSCSKKSGQTEPFIR